MASVKRYDYDVVVIGAGIGGIVCAGYLAKAGFKTILIEKNARPGGYSSSFTRKGFKFDACAHSLGSMRSGGNIDNILKDFDLRNKFLFTRRDPQDVVFYPDGRLMFWNDIERTVDEFQKAFKSEERPVRRFFDFLDGCSGAGLNSIKSITFQELLDKYFTDSKIKAVLSFPIFGNLGMSPSGISALTAVTLYKEFILDGGYYPEGGMQAFVDILVGQFKAFGGKLLLASPVTGILADKNGVKGVVINKEEVISSKYIVADCDSMQVFTRLLDKEIVGYGFMDKINSLTPSLSAFVAYLGIEGEIDTPCVYSNAWYLPHYDIEKLYDMTQKGDVEDLNWFLTRYTPDNRTVTVLVNVPYKNTSYWQENKKALLELFIKRSRKVFGDISSKIVFKDAATPATLYRWTLNYKGAAYGWESTPAQFAVQDLSQATVVKNLYLTGHWTTLAQGIPGVAYLGRGTARMILAKDRRQKGVCANSA